MATTLIQTYKSFIVVVIFQAKSRIYYPLRAKKIEIFREQFNNAV